jgi:hypothetical protein
MEWLKMKALNSNPSNLEKKSKWGAKILWFFVDWTILRYSVKDVHGATPFYE